MNTLIILISGAALVLAIFMALSSMDLSGEAVTVRLRSALIVGLLGGLSLTNSLTTYSQVKDLQAQSEAYEVQLDKRNQQIGELRVQRSTLENQLDSVKARYEVALSANKGLTQKVEVAQAKQAATQEALDKLKAENRVDAKQYEALKAKYEKAKSILQEIKGVTQ